MKIVLTILLTLNLFSCSFFKLRDKEKEITEYIKENPQYKYYEKLMRASKVEVGMPKEALFISLGRPFKTKVDWNLFRTKKTYFFVGQTVVVRDGKVTSIH